MNTKSYGIAVIATYVVMSILGVASSMITMEQMASYIAIARPEAELMAMAPWMYVGYLIVTVIFCYIYVKGRESGGWIEGARFGLLFGVLMSGISMVMYSALPVDMTALITEIIVTLIIYTVGWITVGTVYKPSSSAANDS